MSDLSGFPEDIQNLLVSLPYKAGIFISHAEDEEGEGDDAGEMSALERALITKVKEYGKDQAGASSLVGEVASRTLRQKSDWQAWADDVFHIEKNCEKAVQFLKANVSDSDVKAYIRLILDVMNSVAEAYGEFGMPEEQPKGIKGMIKKLLGGNTDANNPMNVSAAEDDSIERVTKALKKYA